MIEFSVQQFYLYSKYYLFQFMISRFFEFNFLKNKATCEILFHRYKLFYYYTIFHYSTQFWSLYK